MLNVFDIGIILLCIMDIIVGFKKGVVKEGISLIGIIIVFVISFAFKGILGNILCTFLPFFKFSGVIEGLTTINILMYQIIAFMIIFSVLLSVYTLALKISSFLQKLVNMTIVLWLPSKLLGALVSFIKGYIILFIVLLVLVIPLKNQSIFNESSIVNFVLYKTPVLSSYTKNFTSSVTEIYDLAKKVAKDELDTNTANLETLDIMLKYNIVEKSTIERLEKLHKLDDINNLDSVLSKY